jgi:hypothetical protein
MKRLFITIILALSCTHCASLRSTNPNVLQPSDMVRTATDAEKKAVKARISASASVETKAMAVVLIRAHMSANEIDRGDWVWLVSVTQVEKKSKTADQITHPVPNDLVWVRAKDGWVADLVPSK